MSQQQKSRHFDKLWFLSLIGIVITMIYLYMDSSMIEFQVFDKISLFLFTVIPGGLVVMVNLLVIKSKQIKEIPQNSIVFLAFSFISWFTAEQIWNFYEQILGADPFPSLADVFYVSAPLFLFASLIIFLKPHRKQISKKSIFLASSISIILLIPTIIITTESSNDNLFESLVGIFYPLSDSLVLVPVILTILFVVKKKTNPFWLMILIGVLIFIFADTVFLFLESTDTYTTHHPVDVLWLLSYLIWFYSLWRSIHYSKYVFSSNEEISDYRRYETQTLTKHGVTIFLIIINITVLIVLYSLQQLQIQNSDSGFLNYFSIILVMLLVIFSTVIILLNKILYRNLEHRTTELEDLSKELIKSERLSAIGELSARLAHDLRNPLSVIKMSVDLLKNTSSDSKIITRIDMIDKSVDRISHQVNDVLDYVRNSPLKKSDLSLRSLVLDCIEKIKVPNNVHIKVLGKNIELHCDPIKLEAVVVNLIINGIQAILESGNIDIKIDEKDDDVVLEFTDSGSGIPDKSLDDIFEPLFTTKQKGTGLGLAICRNIIEQHGGTIKVKTNPTTFVVTLPKNL